jgi:hypothetical protein
MVESWMNKKTVKVTVGSWKISWTILCALSLAILVGTSLTSSARALTSVDPGYTILNLQIVKLEDSEPIPTSSFLLTDEAVYLHFEIDWQSLDDCERTHFTQKLYSPDGNVSEKSLSFYTEILGQGYAMESGNLLLFNITSMTELGSWSVEWYDSDTLVLVGEAGMAVIPEFPNSFILVIFLTAVAGVAMFLGRKIRRNPTTSHSPVSVSHALCS